MTMKNDLEASEAVGEIHRACSRLDYLMRECQWDELAREAAKIGRASLDLETRAGLLAERAV